MPLRTKCARGSIRTLVKKGGRVLVRVCCPPGKWMPRKKRCKVGMKLRDVVRR